MKDMHPPRLEVLQAQLAEFRAEQRGHPAGGSRNRAEARGPTGESGKRTGRDQGSERGGGADVEKVGSGGRAAHCTRCSRYRVHETFVMRSSLPHWACVGKKVPAVSDYGRYLITVRRKRSAVKPEGSGVCDSPCAFSAPCA